MYCNTLDALLMDKAMEMIFGFDENGVILFANPAARRALGYGEAMIGMNLRSIVRPVVSQNRISFELNLKADKAKFNGKNGEDFVARIRLLKAQGEETLSFLLALKNSRENSA